VGRLLGKVIVMARRQAGAFTAASAADSLPVTLCGHPTASPGTALALTQIGLPYLDVVRPDAPADFNTRIPSRSGQGYDPAAVDRHWLSRRPRRVVTTPPKSR
jgi:hypothetical protein